jgi:hypothetical protein
MVLFYMPFQMFDAQCYLNRPLQRVRASMHLFIPCCPAPSMREGT